jgi:flagellar M-ring protein FliF
MKAILDGLRAIGLPRVAAIGAVGLGMLGLFGFLILRGGNEPMVLLYGDLDLRDSGQITEQLGRQHVPFRIGGGGSQILVPADMVAQARVSLARDGLPTGGSVGYEIFDRSDGLAATEFQQRINQTRALEGELARTIRAINGVRAVRVHLVLSRREPFARERQDPQASVLLTMAGATRLDREGVQAILNLVAAAVPGLRPQNIAVVDSRGDLLARAGEAVGTDPGASVSGQAMSNEEVRRTTELRLSRAVEEMLERSLGSGRVRAEAAVRMSFDRVNQTEERFDPDGQVTRSTQSVNSTSKSTEANGSVTVQNNLPNADAGSNPAGSQEARQEETTNYEVSKTVRTLIREQPQIERISLAVMVDGVAAAGPDGKPAWQPRPAEELSRITSLVKTAIGFDARRGDTVEVESMRFVTGDDTPTAAPTTLLGLGFEKADLLRLAETGLIGLIGVLALLLVLRPMVMRLTTLAPLGIGGPLGGSSLGGSPGGVMAALAGAGGNASAEALLGAPSGSAAAALLEDESMVSIAQIEGQLRASSIRRISDLADKHPDETLAILRGWIAQESG